MYNRRFTQNVKRCKLKGFHIPKLISSNKKIKCAPVSKKCRKTCKIETGC